MLTSHPLLVDTNHVNCMLAFKAKPLVIVQLLASSSIIMPKSFIVDLGIMLIADPPTIRMWFTFCSLM